MIPTLIVCGLVFGRWWRTALGVGALGWPLALVAMNVMDVEPDLLLAAALGVVNTSLGVLMHQGARTLLVRLRHQGTPVRRT